MTNRHWEAPGVPMSIHDGKKFLGGEARIAELEHENERLRKVVEAARMMRGAKEHFPSSRYWSASEVAIDKALEALDSAQSNQESGQPKTASSSGILRCDGQYGGGKQGANEPCGWEGYPGELTKRGACPVCSARYIVPVVTTPPNQDSGQPEDINTAEFQEAEEFRRCVNEIGAPHTEFVAAALDMFTFERKRADYWAQRCLRIEAAAKRVLDNGDVTNRETAMVLAESLELIIGSEEHRAIESALDEAEQRGPSPKALAVARLEAKIEALEWAIDALEGYREALLASAPSKRKDRDDD